MLEIKENYPTFDISDENIERHYRYLNDFPFPQAKKNVEQYIKANEYAPKIAHIRGHLGDLKDSEISKRQAVQYEQQLQRWSVDSPPPPGDYFERVRKQLRGEQSE